MVLRSWAVGDNNMNKNWTEDLVAILLGVVILAVALLVFLFQLSTVILLHILPFSSLPSPAVSPGVSRGVTARGCRVVTALGQGVHLTASLNVINDEVAHHPAIIGMHARSVGIEDPCHPDLHAMLAMVVEEQGLGASLALVVAGPRSNRVHPP